MRVFPHPRLSATTILSPAIPHRRALRRVLAVGVLMAATCLGIEGLGNAEANGETRALTIQHMHTHETATITYKSGGQFSRDGLDKLNWILRDWRRDEPISMDPRLFDVVWEATRATGASGPIHVVSGYRSPATNAMLRQRSNLVAKNSQHMLGKAMDFYLTDVSMDKVRDVGMRLQRGGVGYYPTSYTPFVHLDVGSVRHWPRMSHDQLARLFPDGKTVHVGTDGKQFPRYAEAYAEVIAAGGTVGGYSGDGEETAISDASSGSGKGFFAWLFGLSDDDGGSAKSARPSRSARRGAPSDTPVQPANYNDTSPIAALQQYEASQTLASAQPSRSRGQSIASASPEDRNEPAPARTVAAPVEKVAPIPAVAQTELRPITQPLDRSPKALAVASGPQLVWQNGPAPLPPQARGNATPIVVAVTFPSLAGYKRVDVPLPPQGRSSVSINLAAARVPPIAAKPDSPMAVAKGPNGLPAVITGTKPGYDGPALAYMDNGAGKTASVPMPPSRPPEFGKSPVSKQFAAKANEPKIKQAPHQEPKTVASQTGATSTPAGKSGPQQASIGTAKDDPQTTSSLSNGFKQGQSQTTSSGFTLR